MSLLIDTDVCSAHLKSNALMHRFVQYSGGLHISVVILAELFTWALRAKAPRQRLQAVLDFLNDVVVLDVTPSASRKSGELQAAFLDAGAPAPEMDLLIAATALTHNLTLVTHNVRDFAKIPGLSISDWLAP